MTMELTQEAAAEVDLDQIVRDLNVDWYTTFPEAAIRAAQRHREAITPKLIEVLRSAAANAKAGRVPVGSAPTIALFLLAEFQATEALPAVIEAISLPDEDSYELFGELLTEDISRLLAIFAPHQWDAIDELIRNQQMSEYVRWTIAETYALLFRDDRISRETALDRLTRLLREAIDAQDYRIGPGLVSALLRFAPKECFDDIKRAYEAGIADDEIISLDSCRKVIDGEEESKWFDSASLGPSQVTDTVSELASWGCFQPDEDEDEIDDAPLAWQRIDSRHSPYPSLTTVHKPVEPEPMPLPSTIRSDQPRVGRNQSCPCGSGKKFKKCCGSRM